MHSTRTGSPRSVGVTSLLTVILFLTAACSPADDSDAPAGASGAIVYEGARLILGDGRPAMENGAFVVENGRITEVGTQGQISVPAGAARVDLTGRTVMPALIDTHKHLASDRETLVDQLEHFAYWGIGAVMSLGQDVGEDPFQIREEVIPGAARFRTAGRGITSPEPGRSEVPYWVSTEEEARAAVREQAAQEVDIVKIWVDDRDGTYEKLSPALYRAVIDEAHNHGLRVTAHIFGLEDAKELLRAGVDAFAHGIRDQDVDEEIVALFQERPNVVLVPNMPDRGVAVDLGWLGETVPAEQLASLQEGATDRPSAQQAFGIQARNLIRLKDAGVPIAFGTDGPNPWAAHLELEDMVAAGMTPAEALEAATRTSAEFLRLGDAGTLLPGMSADFIVLDANPLDDIRNTRRISAVYLRGAEIDRTALRRRWTGR